MIKRVCVKRSKQTLETGFKQHKPRIKCLSKKNQVFKGWKFSKGSETKNLQEHRDNFEYKQNKIIK